MLLVGKKKLMLVIILLQANSDTLSKLSSNTITVSNWTILASIAAIISAISAFRSSLFSKKSSIIAQKAYLDKQANFNIYLVRAYRYTAREQNNKKLLLFEITIKNISDSKSSFKADLEIEYAKDGFSNSKITIPHENSLSELFKTKFSFYPNDIRIDERGLTTKWLIFEQPNDIFKSHRIDQYRIKIIDAQSNIAISELNIIHEFIDEKNQNEN